MDGEKKQNTGMRTDNAGLLTFILSIYDDYFISSAKWGEDEFFSPSPFVVVAVVVCLLFFLLRNNPNFLFLQ